MARTLTQALAQDERFQAALADLFCKHAQMEGHFSFVAFQSHMDFLHWRYQQQLSLKAIAARLRCSVTTLHRSYEADGHHFLYRVLRRQSPDFAEFVKSALNISEPR